MIGYSAIGLQPIAGELLPGVAAPVAAFSGTPLSGNAPLSVGYTDQSLNNPTSWFYDFGDGNTSTLQNPTHVYAVAGTYTVALTATNAGGSNTDTKPAYISVVSADVGGDDGESHWLNEFKRKKLEDQNQLKKKRRKRVFETAVALLLVD